jgi:hypothetical protein
MLFVLRLQYQQITVTHECIYLRFGLRKGKKLNLKPSSAKQKGRLLQQWVVAQLLERFSILEQGDIVNTSMGAPGEDVKLSPAARKVIPYQVECKNLSKIAVYQHYEQAKTHGKHEPLVIMKQNQSKPLAVVDAQHFLDVLAELYSLKNQVDVLLLVKGK